MPLILQAPNDDIPIIDLLLPQDLPLCYMQFVNKLRRSISLPTLGTPFQMFEEPFYLPALIQNTILRDTDGMLGLSGKSSFLKHTTTGPRTLTVQQLQSQEPGWGIGMKTHSTGWALRWRGAWEQT